MGIFATQTEGTLRVRRHDDGEIDVWVQGWRLEIRFLSFVPVLLAVGFAFSSIFLPLRILGCGGLLGAAVMVHRLTKVGIRMGAAGLRFNDLVRTREFPWDDVVTFMGERTRHDGKLVLLRKDGSKVAGPGSLTGEDMNPIGDEGDLSVVEELNRLTERFRRGLPVVTPASQAAVEPRRLVRARGPRTRPRAPQPQPQPAPPSHPQVHAIPDVEAPAAQESPPYRPVEPPPLRHPHVPRPPKPEPEPEPTGRAARRARRRRGTAAPPLIQVPDADHMSPGARLLASLDDPQDRS
jgi:hypothetical protein